MENIFITKDELEDFKMELEGIKSTIEILQNKELMGEINKSEQNREKGIEVSEIKI